MQTYNLEFSSYEELDSFILNHPEINTHKEVLVQVFSGILDVTLLQKITSHILLKIPQAKIIGATTDGEIINDKVNTKSIVISISTFTKSTLNIAYIQSDVLKDSYSLGEQLALKLKKDDSKVFILFADGLNTNGEEFLEGILNKSEGVVLSGGLSGDNGTFEGSYLIYQDKVFKSGAVGISINSNDLIIHNNYSFAWENIGREFTVNKSHNNIVYEIDNMLPVDLYKKYLGDEVANLLPSIGIEFPFIIQDGDFKIARAVLAKNDDGSLVFAGNIKEGSKVRLGVGDINHLIEDAKELALNISQVHSESIFIYSCMARRRFLGNQADEDLKYLSKIGPLAGFYTYGEFFSHRTSCKFLNESMTVLSLSEKSNEPALKLHFADEPNKALYMTTLRALSHLANTTSKEWDEINHNLHTKVISEIEKNIEYEKKVFDSMKMASLGDMIANIAHQWRQPLSVITTSASAMQLNKDLGILDDTLFSKYTEMMIAQAMYLSETINTFRDFIQAEHRLSNIVLQDEIENTLKILDVVLKDNGIQLVKNLNHEQPITVQLVMGELSQVIINIMNNAKDSLNEIATATDKWIELNLLSDEDKCIITIEDNGSGIPETILPKIFEQNFTTKDKSVGTGIGLYMSYNIVKKHFGGDLYAENTENGAKFFIEIPLTK